MRKNKIFSIVLIAFTFGILGALMPSTTVKARTMDIDTSQYEPTGNPNVSYPQISIRTDRAPERTNIAEIVKLADEAAAKYPIGDSAHRSKAVTKRLISYFGSGSLGHAWIVIFHSNKPGDYTSYGFHEVFGWVKNGSSYFTDDSAGRKFAVEKTLPLGDDKTSCENIEKTIMPHLSEESVAIARMMGVYVFWPSRGAYSPIGNCAWAAGNLWNAVTGDNLNFEQEFDGAAHASDWGMPFLNGVTKIADPGMVAESIAK
ncbi:hypothetical protein [Lactococcus ileimucosae]|uniref:hypothetical protein n=1 Tax=Lactococcus ileimucosae TaxID=2941329 RepID=UPI0020445D30|nr:hypothetical protein [Lactococcus ileimucosae]